MAASISNAFSTNEEAQKIIAFEEVEKSYSNLTKIILPLLDSMAALYERLDIDLEISMQDLQKVDIGIDRDEHQTKWTALKISYHEIQATASKVKKLLLDFQSQMKLDTDASPQRSAF